MTIFLFFHFQVIAQCLNIIKQTRQQSITPHTHIITPYSDFKQKLYLSVFYALFFKKITVTTICNCLDVM